MFSDRLHNLSCSRVAAAVRGVLLTAAVLLTGPASAHAPYTAFMTPFGQPCCGERDCAPLADGDVSIVSGGFYIASRREFVPSADAQAGPDERYHICTFNGLRMCFLIPPGKGA